MENIPEGKMIPIEAYRYWPKGKYVYTGSEKSLVRFIFYKIEFTEFELKHLQLFKDYIRQHASGLALPPYFTDEELIRIVLGCKFNYKQSLSALLASISWRSENLSNGINTLLMNCKDLLNSGFIYFHGRDSRFRPLLVINVSKLDLSKHSVDSYCYLLCFLLEFAIQKLFIPGQIENWIVITDLNGQGVTQLPISEIKRIIKILQDNFRCRMIVNYVVNAPSSLYFMWKVAKTFVAEHTVKKIIIIKDGMPVEMRKHFNKLQYEVKYGGMAPNITTYWPPTFPPGPYDADRDSVFNYFTDLNTYHLYNPQSPSELSSRMDSVSEDVEVFEFPEVDFKEIELERMSSCEDMESNQTNNRKSRLSSENMLSSEGGSRRNLESSGNMLGVGSNKGLNDQMINITENSRIDDPDLADGSSKRHHKALSDVVRGSPQKPQLDSSSHGLNIEINRLQKPKQHLRKLCCCSKTCEII